MNKNLVDYPMWYQDYPGGSRLTYFRHPTETRPLKAHGAENYDQFTNFGRPLRVEPLNLCRTKDNNVWLHYHPEHNNMNNLMELTGMKKYHDYGVWNDLYDLNNDKFEIYRLR